MALMLKAVSYRNELLSRPKFATVVTDRDEITVGRAKDNDLVLPDTEKYVSSHHATIVYRAPDYLIADTSTNGVFINGAGTPIGKGKSYTLKDGDRLTIGDYALEVEFSEGASDPVGFPSDDPFAPLDDGQGIEDIIGDNDLYLGERLDDPESVLPHEVHADPTNRRRQGNPDHDIADQSDASHGLAFPTDWFNRASDVPERSCDPEPIKEPPATNCSSSDLIANFVKGAKIDDRVSLTPESFTIIGALLREAVQGAIDALLVRNKIKDLVGMRMTMLNAVNNNPIKFSVGADEALRKLLTPTPKGYITADRAIAEVFDDIKDHEMAMVASMQTMLKNYARRFDPEILQQDLRKRSPIRSRIPILRKLKLWRLMQQRYKEIHREMTEDFDQSFGQAFGEAYEAQIGNLKKAAHEIPL